MEGGGEVREGMLACAAAPVRAGGRIAGALFGGVLLNRHDDLVDQIRGVVFRGESFGGREIGTTTLFLGDVRVATNVLREDGARAVGTRMSPEVARRVLGDGVDWADRAFVVNEWCFTAYEPIRAPGGEIVGALYVGLLEGPFRRTSDLDAQVILGTIALACLASLVLVWWWRGIFSGRCGGSS